MKSMKDLNQLQRGKKSKTGTQHPRDPKRNMEFKYCNAAHRQRQ